MRSNYKIENLALLEAEQLKLAPQGGTTFVWLDTELAAGAGHAVENLMHSTGGNTLMAATALCEVVSSAGRGATA